MTEETCETRVGNRLVVWLQQQSGIRVLSYHPTSAKAYESELIRIPKLEADGTRTKERYHVDIISLSDKTLWLVELKCKLSESGDDIQKLREIQERYTLKQLCTLIGSRLTTVTASVLDDITSIELGLGVEVLDSPLPLGFSIFTVTDQSVTVTKSLF